MGRCGSNPPPDVMRESANMFIWANRNQQKQVDISLVSVLEVLRTLRLISFEAFQEAINCDTSLLGIENEEE
jgi:hypothetical protein